MDQGQSGEIQGREWRLHLYLGVVAVEKGAFGSPSTMVANLTKLGIIFNKLDKLQLRPVVNDTGAAGDKICHADNTDSPDSFPQSVPIIHRSWQVFQTISCIRKLQVASRLTVVCPLVGIHHHHHHHHIVLAARISLTLSRHSSLSFIALGRSSGQQPVSSHSC